MSPNEVVPAGSGALELRIRPSLAGDRPALERLAELDSAPPPAGDYLLAEEGGALRAALPLDGGPPLADPFHETADITALLELRALSLGVIPARGRPRRRRRPARGSLRQPLVAAEPGLTPHGAHT